MRKTLALPREATFATYRWKISPHMMCFVRASHANPSQKPACNWALIVRTTETLHGASWNGCDARAHAISYLRTFLILRGTGADRCGGTSALICDNRATICASASCLRIDSVYHRFVS